MRFIRLFLALLICSLAQAAVPTFVNISVIAADATPHVDLAVNCGAHLTNDIFLLQAWNRDVDETATVTGWTVVTGSPVDRGTTARYWAWWKRAASASETDPVVDFSGTTGDAYGVCTVYRGAITTETPWEVIGTATTGTADPASLATISSLTDNSLIVIALSGEDNNNAGCIATGTDPAAYTEHYQETGTGADAMNCNSEFERVTAGATGTVSVDFDTAVPIGWGAWLMALKPEPASSCAQSIALMGVGCR